MNALEAKKLRAGSSLAERVRASNPERASHIDRLVAEADAQQRVESMVRAIMHIQDVSAAELARRLNSKPPQISRELSGGLSRATLGRIALIAEALGYEFLPTFVPRQNSVKRQRFLKMYQNLIPATDSNESAPMTEPSSKRPYKRKTATKPAQKKARLRRRAGQ